MRAILLFAVFSLAAIAQDSATVLARILAEKGTLTPAEVAQVDAAAAGDRVAVLAAVLKNKGLLTEGDMAKLSPSPVGSPAAIAAGPPPPPAPPAGPPPPARAALAPAPPVTADSKFPLTVYGTILMNAFYNTAATNVADIPLFTAKQGADSFGNDKNFGMTGRQTRIGMRYRGAQVAGGQFTGQVEFDFLGGKAPFPNGVDMDLVRLRLAFGRIDWTHVSVEAGQDWSVFAPLNPTSLAEFAIPSMSASGNPWIRMPQIRTEIHGGSKDGLRYLAQIAAVDPNMGDYNTAVFAATRPPAVGERGRLPGIDARFAVTGSADDHDWTVGFSSHWAHGKNSGLVAGSPVQIPIDSWGGAIDYTVPIGAFFQWSGELYMGRALGLFSVDTGEAFGVPGGIGELGVRSTGGWTQAQFNLARRWQMNLAYGIDSPRVRDLPIGNRTRNQTFMGNLIFKYNPHFSVAAEYRRLLTDFRNQPAADERGDHANLGFAYTF